MTTTTAPPAASTPSGAADPGRPYRRSPLTWIREHLLAAITVVVFVFMLAPNAVILWMSFNQPIGKFDYDWNRFSLSAWKNPCATNEMCHSLGLSVEIGLIATLVSTALGTMIAFAMVRHRFKARSGINSLLFLPMAAPEVVMGATLTALFFNTIGPGSLGFWTITIAHIVFCLSYVVVTVKSRLAGMDPTLERAAQDLYATPLQTFMKVTLPLVAPGIGAAALLAFALSVDDYIITAFTAGNMETFPMYIWGSVQRAYPAQIDVIGSLMLICTMAIIALSQILGRARNARR
ncbi:ABC transporter permease [Streptomyces sp. SL13]|jgi:spermidine/putrescine transport system permease protein|uniref:ABC transporter permease n=1 Tax=Streptantibioticus silvisoli TaxID=2705255 RepID=A0AA90H6P4_9ACTN|nr:ABC transporter permease [Streptantibioticus silvisoli]MDI5965296.1 ABC transporter permease [Streptantibioticus silvisoli]MDI5972921.1 ABC transporter permease [Streptantibioticus silvisoli]